MGSLGGASGNGGLWGFGSFHDNNGRSPKSRRNAAGRDSSGGGGNGYRFPVNQAATAASLSLTGDTIAQLRNRWVRNRDASISRSRSFQDMFNVIFSEHDWIRALRMTSYGFLLYGPGSYAWYKCLEWYMPKQTVQNLMMKVLLNQIVLGPCVITVVFAWNNLWLGKLNELPEKYKRDAFPTLYTGWKFWIPVSILNFWLIPLQARVGFMSMGSVFWNFYLSTTMSK